VSAGEDAWIGLGSNLDGPTARVSAAFDALAGLPQTTLVARSPLYASAPMGPADQPDYVNAVAHLRTTLAPHALLDELQRLESEAGRQRTGQRWGGRELDLDLLAYGDRQCADARLTLPHVGVGERAFVLRPLSDLAPELELPRVGSIQACLAAVDTSDLRRLGAAV